jgi:protocatechuate 3,4-dioxygenase beta subunit
VQAILDEEIGRLPEIYRQPFILCCLENRGRAEVARQLEVKEATLRSRLAQARKLLQQRLGRRGVALTGLLGAVALSESTARATASSSLVSSTVKAALAFSAGNTPAAGVASAQVAALVEGGLKTMFVTKCKIATALLLAAGVASGAGLLTHKVLAGNNVGPDQQVAPKPPAQDNTKAEAAKAPGNPRSEAAKPEATDKVEVRGRVLDPDGKPLAGAKLYLSSPRPEIEQDYKYNHEERATSGPDGRFRLTLTPEELAQDGSLLLATAKDYGPDWVSLDKKKLDGELSLRLVKDDVPIKGRIIDVEGRPVSGAKLRVQLTKAFREQDGLDKHLEYIRAGGYEQAGGGETVWGPLPGQPTEITTDSAGRFTLTGVGRERVVRFAIEGPSIQHWAFVSMTRAADTVRGPSYGTKVYGANFDFVAAASVPIRGKVRDKATGKPVAGVKISGNLSLGGLTTHTTRTDKNGAYELRGYPRSETYHLLAQPAEGQAYFAEMVDRPDTPGSDSITADIDLIAGIPLGGQVTDAVTKRPVKGAKVYYYPLQPNRYAARISYNIFLGASSATTRGDGSFRLVVLPGPGVVTLECSGKHPYMPALVTDAELKDFFKDKDFPSGGDGFSLVTAPGKDGRIGGIVQERYQALALINPEEKVESLKQNLTVQPGRTLTGTILGTDGKPLAGATIDVQGFGPPYGDRLPTASFTLTNLNPRRAPLEVEFRHKEKGLGLLKEIRCDAAEPLTVQLQPYGSVIGRILDKDGKPLPDVPMRIYHPGETEIRRKTDRDGGFRVDELVVGRTYALLSPVGGAILTLEDGKVISLPKFTIEPGKVKDLGDAKPSKVRE